MPDQPRRLRPAHQAPQEKVIGNRFISDGLPTLECIGDHCQVQNFSPRPLFEVVVVGQMPPLLQKNERGRHFFEIAGYASIQAGKSFAPDLSGRFFHAAVVATASKPSPVRPAPFGYDFTNQKMKQSVVGSGYCPAQTGLLGLPGLFARQMIGLLQQIGGHCHGSVPGFFLQLRLLRHGSEAGIG